MVRHIALLVGMTAACTAGRDVASDASDDSTAPSSRTVKTLRGSRWIVPTTRTTGHDIDDGVMTAFRDLDGDDQLNPDTEPSTPCLMTLGRWHCHVEPRQITVLRSDGPTGNDIFVLPRWTDDRGMRYCVGDETGCSAPFEPTPTRTSEIRSSCGDAPVIWLDTEPPHPIELGDHPPIAATVTTRRMATGDVEVQIEDGAPERAFAWVGRGETPTWDSERSAAMWRVTEQGLAITIPAATFRACDGCGVDLAIAHHRRWRDAATAALVLDVRERRFHLEVAADDR